MKNNNFTKVISLLLICLIILTGYYFLNQNTGIFIPCVFHELTNLHCPGCGITRMIFSILQFDFYQAFRYNPLIFILLILFIFYYPFKNKINDNITNKILYLLLIIIILYGIARNIPILDFLKPTNI